MSYYVYILKCKGNTLYTGITPDVCRRMTAHAAGRGARYTRSHPPEALEALWRAEDKVAAARLEYAIKKRLTRQQKLRLIAESGGLAELLPDLAELGFHRIAGVTLERCLRGEWDG